MNFFAHGRTGTRRRRILGQVRLKAGTAHSGSCYPDTRYEHAAALDVNNHLPDLPDGVRTVSIHTRAAGPGTVGSNIVHVQNYGQTRGTGVQFALDISPALSHLLPGSARIPHISAKGPIKRYRLRAYARAACTNMGNLVPARSGHSFSTPSAKSVLARARSALPERPCRALFLC